MENKTSHCTFPRLHMDVTLEHPEERLRITCEAGTWAWAETYKPHFRIGDGELIYFSEAREIVHETYENGVGAGIASTYKGFSGSGDAARFCFQTLIWIEACTGDVHLEWIPLAESRSVTAVYWPGPMEFEAARSDWYTLLNLRQGLLLPNDWPHPLEGIPFNGLFGTAASYMPWFAQVRQGQGYMLICETPANAGYEAEHPAGGAGHGWASAWRTAWAGWRAAAACATASSAAATTTRSARRTASTRKSGACLSRWRKRPCACPG